MDSGEFDDDFYPREMTSRSQVRWLLILRDVAIVWAMTFVGGFIVGMVFNMNQLDRSQLVIAIAITNLVAGTLAFTLIGCISPPNRWLHLSLVALFTWLTSAVNIQLIGASVQQWMAGSIAVMMMMGLGGAISLGLKSDASDDARPVSTSRSRLQTSHECPMCGACVSSDALNCPECGEIITT